MSLQEMADSGDPFLRSVAKRYGFRLPPLPGALAPRRQRRAPIAVVGLPRRPVEQRPDPLPRATVASLEAWQSVLAQLWSAVLEQACDDLQSSDKRLAKRAFEWLFSTSTGPQSCEWICVQLGFDAAVWRKGVELRLEAHLRGEAFWLHPPPRSVLSRWDVPPGIEEGKCRR